MGSSKAKSGSTEASQAIPASFEEAVAELEALVEAMDSQNLGLDRLLTDYRRGAFLVKHCRDRLNQVRLEVADIEQSLNQSSGEGEQ